MKNGRNEQPSPSFLKKHGFKLILCGVLAYLFFQEDLSLQIHLGTPTNNAQPMAVANPTPEVMEPAKSTYATAPQPATTPKNQVTSSSLLSDLAGSFLGSKEVVRKPEAFPILDRMAEETKRNYLRRFAKVAYAEQHKYGVPAPITLASALLHSHSGTQELAATGNNHFQLKCSGWNGSAVDYLGDCYRKYDNAWMSFRDHSQYLTSGKFAGLRQLGSTDYLAWSAALEQLGYSDEPNLAEKLNNLIEQYRLYEIK